MKLFLRDDLAATWGRDPFAAALKQQGEVYRDKEGRRTLRFDIEGRGYFLKLHQGVGWGEVFKNLAQGRLPVLGAANEYRAIRELEKLGLDTLSVAGYGRRGIDPSKQLSFLVTDELVGVESLEDFCARWPQQKPDFALKRRLIQRVADISKIFHGAGLNHRDYYLCHLLLETQARPGEYGEHITAENIGRRRIYMLDLHRAQIRSHVPWRWLVKDIGGLYYSALDIGLSARDIFRFMRRYRQRPLREILNEEGKFWRAVAKRARQIYLRDFGREPSSSAWLGPRSSR